jgi:hypothetical protein
MAKGSASRPALEDSHSCSLRVRSGAGFVTPSVRQRHVSEADSCCRIAAALETEAEVKSFLPTRRSLHVESGGSKPSSADAQRLDSKMSRNSESQHSDTTVSSHNAAATPSGLSQSPTSSPNDGSPTEREARYPTTAASTSVPPATQASRSPRATSRIATRSAPALRAIKARQRSAPRADGPARAQRGRPLLRSARRPRMRVEDS